MSIHDWTDGQLVDKQRSYDCRQQLKTDRLSFHYQIEDASTVDRMSGTFSIYFQLNTLRKDELR